MAKKDGVVAWLMFVLVAGFLMYEMALQVAPSVMTSAVMADMHLNAKSMSMAMGVYFFSYAAMQIPGGMLFDRFSARGIITTVVSLCALSAWLMGHAHNAVSLGLARLVMGGASAFAFVAVLTIAYRWFSDRYYASLVGMTQLLAALGAVFGTAPLAEHLATVNWHTAFDQLAVVGAGLAVVIFLIVRQSPTGSEVHAEAKDLSFRDSIRIVGGNSQTWWLFFYAFLIWGPVTVFSALWGTDYLKTLYSISTVEASQFSWYFWLALAGSSPVWGCLTDKIGQRGPVMRISSALGFAVSIAMIAYPEISMPAMRVLLILFGTAVSGHIISFAVVKDINKQALANKITTMIAITRAGINPASDTPMVMAMIFNSAKAKQLPIITGSARWRLASIMQTSWLLSPISANKINAKVDKVTVSISAVSV